MVALSKRVLISCMFALSISSARPVFAETIRWADMVRGTKLTPQQCNALQSAVWVQAYGQGFCFRYYFSMAGGVGDSPVIWLPGDKLGRLNLKTNEFYPTDHDKDIETADLMKFADTLSKWTKSPAVYIGRIGVDGSSGRSSVRHTRLELEATNKAISAIKARHGFARVHLAGQSGGASLIGGLLALRSDIGCAVPGSGRLSGAWNKRRSMMDPLQYFDASAASKSIARHSSARIFVITSPGDKVVAASKQSAFADAIAQAGGPVQQFFVPAFDKDQHNVVPYTRLAVSRCIQGKSAAEIALELGRYAEKLKDKAKAQS